MDDGIDEANRVIGQLCGGMCARCGDCIGDRVDERIYRLKCGIFSGFATPVAWSAQIAKFDVGPGNEKLFSFDLGFDFAAFDVVCVPIERLFEFHE